MKSIVLILSLMLGVQVYTQNYFEPYFSIKFGVNTLDSAGDESPFDSFTSSEEMAFSNPYALGVDYRFSRLLSIGLFGSINKWKSNNQDIIDGFLITEEIDYFSVDLNVKVYIDELIFRANRNNWLDVYVSLGGSYFREQDSGFSGNVGLGGNIWILDNLGINVEGVGKFAGQVFTASNHFQYFAGLTYRFNNKTIKYSEDEKNEEDEIKEEIPIESTLAPEIIIINKDSDNDGVTDDFDKCPDVPGEITNMGCPDDSLEDDSTTDDVSSTKETILRLSKNINFTPGNYNFTQESYATLIEISEILKALPNSATIFIEGHTDSTGSFDANRKLSQYRGNAVKNYFVESGVIAKITVVAHGELRPIASNLSKEGRRKNRRVEISIDK